MAVCGGSLSLLGQLAAGRHSRQLEWISWLKLQQPVNLAAFSDCNYTANPILMHVEPLLFTMFSAFTEALPVTNLCSCLTYGVGAHDRQGMQMVFAGHW